MAWSYDYETPVDSDNNLIISNEQYNDDLKKDLQYRMIPGTPAFTVLRSIDSVKLALYGLSKEEVDRRVMAWRGNHQSNHPRWAGTEVIVQLRDGSSMCWGEQCRLNNTRKLLIFDSNDKIHVVWAET